MPSLHSIIDGNVKTFQYGYEARMWTTHYRLEQLEGQCMECGNWLRVRRDGSGVFPGDHTIDPSNNPYTAPQCKGRHKDFLKLRLKNG